MNEKSRVRQIIEKTPRVILAGLTAVAGFLFLIQIANAPVEAANNPKPAPELAKPAKRTSGFDCSMLPRPMDSGISLNDQGESAITELKRVTGCP